MKKFLTAVTFVVIPLQISWGVGSGGYTNQVVGSKALGMGNAFVATADDPSAIFFNPAGLTQLEQASLSLGLAVHGSNTKYTANDGTTDTMEKFNPVVPNFYATVPFLEKWAFGFGINSPFGLETHWSNDSPLRYEATNSKLHLVNFNPSIAYKLNSNISLGGGIVYGQTNATLESRLNQSALNSFLNGALTLSPDGGKKLEGDGHAWGYDFGLLFKPIENHSIGITYRSQLAVRIDGTTELSGLSGTAAAVFGGPTYKVDAETVVKFPQSVMVGYAYKPNKWTFEVDGEWVDYGAVNNTSIAYKGESDPTRLSILNTGNPTNHDWNYTWNLGLGTNYKFNDTWQARGGYFYYPQAIPTATWDPGNPEASRNGFTLGGSFTKSPFIIDLAYNLILFNNRTINNNVGATSASTVNGKYDATAYILSANITYKFGGTK